MPIVKIVNLSFITKLRDNTSVINALSKLLTAQIIVQVVAFFLATIITRLYSTTDFGVLAIFMSIAGFFSILATARLEYAIILPKSDDEANAITLLSVKSSFFTALFSILFLYVFKTGIQHYFQVHITTHWYILMPLVVFFTAFFNIMLQYHNRFKAYKQIASAQISAGVSQPIISIFIQNIIAFGLIYAVFISNFIGSLYLASQMRKKKWYVNTMSNYEVIKKYRAFPTYNLLHAVLNFVSSSLPVFMLSAVFETQIIGLFTMALGKVFKPINLFGNAIYQVYSKKMIDAIHQQENAQQQFKQVFLTLFLAGIIPFLVLYVYAPPLFALFFGKEWFQAGVYLQLLLPWLFMVYLTTSFTFIPNLFNQQKKALVIEVIYLLLRFLALQYGIRFNNIELALSLYAIVGVIVLIFTLLWYNSLLKTHK